MASIDMCEHDWSGWGCKECKIESLERQVKTLTSIHGNLTLLLKAISVVEELYHAVCSDTGFAQAVRQDSGKAYPWESLTIAERNARSFFNDIRQSEFKDRLKYKYGSTWKEGDTINLGNVFGEVTEELIVQKDEYGNPFVKASNGFTVYLVDKVNK